MKKDIYIIKNDINKKVYVGQSVNVRARFNSHCSSPDKTSLIDKAIQKYGKEHFFYEILESQIENFNEREQYWIRYYGCQTPFGYNITMDGQSFVDDRSSTKMSEREEDIDAILDLLKYTYRSHGDIAHEFGVTAQTIKDIDIGKYHRRDGEKYPIRIWKSRGSSCLTYEQVTKIIDLLLNTSVSVTQIAKEYNVDRSVVIGICRGTTKRYRRDSLNYPLRAT